MSGTPLEKIQTVKMETTHGGESITQVGKQREANNESQKTRRTVRFKNEDEAYSASTTPISSLDPETPLHENEPKIVNFAYY